jgi:signal transduction histidine kinase
MNPIRSYSIYCILGMLILLGVVAGATYVWLSPMIVQTVRWLIVCGLFALLGLFLFIHSLQRLSAKSHAPLPEVLPNIPRDTIQQQREILCLENRLEHSPIALFSVSNGLEPKTVQAINGNARRLIAPGRATQPQQLFELLKAQSVGKRNLILFETEQGIERALLSCSSVSIGGASELMIALMPVESELQLEAQNAWLKLIHVLTHEIMNSLTPVTSLSRTAHDLLIENKTQLSDLDFQDLSMSLDAINRRARGLADFVSSYRSLSNVPEANPVRVSIEALFARLTALVGVAWQERGGRMECLCEPPSLEVMADEAQLEQALINLIKNAAEATHNLAQPELRLHAKLVRGSRLRLEVSDNGPGVPEDLITQIFTPFFSTKDKGSGIGLALVRQLIQGNGGTVRYARRVQGGAQFIVMI